ncbi:MAG: Glucose-1-phosphate thymidylyl transferase [Thermoanaerobacterales bacterium 50_218]|nr:MAG: Glucose-1-phosphate thymidylyl transferase [Thermoanaerobacterales bacterium 50_218]HAA90677.1 nucleotidyl transferase [Peptococcaceae bacterium]
MKALVIAAGEGRRFQEKGYKGPKPLYPLLGLSLIERTLLTLREAGIRDIVLVVGYRGEEIRSYLGSGEQLGIKIEYVTNSAWELGNGSSVLAAKEALQEEPSFLLTMADHVSSPEVFKRLLEVRPRGQEVYVGADFKLSSVPDLQEATKIAVTDGKVRAIGKELEEFQAVDCGAFHATPALFEALSQAQAQGKHTLSDGITVLACQGQALVCDIGEAWWIDVDQPEDAEIARKLLLSRLPSPRDGLIARYINRKLSVPLTAFLAGTRITPNQISVCSGFLCLLAALFFAWGHLVWGGLLAQLASVIDGVDGELARLKFLASPFGELLDSVLDRYGDGAILIGMAVAAFDGKTDPLVFAFAALALLGAPMSMLMKEKFRTATGRTYLPEQEGVLVNLLLGNRDGRLFVVMLAGLFQAPFVGLAVLGITPHLLALFRLNMMKKIIKTR